jgi:hypothetical protein
VIPLLAPALLAALVITEMFGGHGRSLIVDARAGGPAAAAVAIAACAPLAVVVLAPSRSPPAPRWRSSSWRRRGHGAAAALG